MDGCYWLCRHRQCTLPLVLVGLVPVECVAARAISFARIAVVSGEGRNRLACAYDGRYESEQLLGRRVCAAKHLVGVNLLSKDTDLRSAHVWNAGEEVLLQRVLAATAVGMDALEEAFDAYVRFLVRVQWRTQREHLLVDLLHHCLHLFLGARESTFGDVAQDMVAIAN